MTGWVIFLVDTSVSGSNGILSQVMYIYTNYKLLEFMSCIFN